MKYSIITKYLLDTEIVITICNLYFKNVLFAFVCIIKNKSKQVESNEGIAEAKDEQVLVCVTTSILHTNLFHIWEQPFLLLALAQNNMLLVLWGLFMIYSLLPTAIWSRGLNVLSQGFSS